MIAHFSMPAARPRQTAEAFARIIDGVAMPFPVVQGAWIAMASDGSGTAVELVPDTTAIELLPEGSRYEAGLRAPPREATAIHFAITTRLSMDEVLALAAAEGWRAEYCSRGPFDLIEIWIDDRQMVEVLPPESTARYLAFARPDVAAPAFAAMAA